MQFLQAFLIAIIDEDYEGKQASGIGMRQLAEALEKEGFRVVAGVSYEDAQRLAEVFNNESCWLVSVDGAEAGDKQWQVLEQILATKRRRNDRLPIFLFGDERTAEMVPACVLKHANAFMQLFEDSPEFIARAIARAAQNYLDRPPPPMFKALMDYTLQAYERLVRGRVESVEIDNLMDRMLAVMVVPYPPGIPLIMPVERLTSATQSIQDYLLYARDFDRKFPGFETDIHGLRFETTPTDRRYLVDCIA
jgi:arginine/lysine/ornithine decarboxylase